MSNLDFLLITLLVFHWVIGMVNIWASYPEGFNRKLEWIFLPFWAFVSLIGLFIVLTEQ